MGGLIAAAVLVLIGLIPVGARVRYDAGGPQVQVVAWLLHITLYPRPKKPKKVSGEKKAKKKPEKKPKKKPEPEKKPTGNRGGSLTDFLPLLQLGLSLLNSFRRRLRADRLFLRLTLTGDDPCDLAVNYGRAQATMGSLQAALERVLRVRKRDLEIACDFTAEQMLVELELQLTVTIGALTWLGIYYGFLMAREYLKIRKRRRSSSVPPKGHTA